MILPGQGKAKDGGEDGLLNLQLPPPGERGRGGQAVAGHAGQVGVGGCEGDVAKTGLLSWA